MNSSVPNLAQVLQALAETSQSTGRTSNKQSINDNYVQSTQNTPTPSIQPSTLLKQDPATITQWSAAIKYVTTKTINDPAIMDRLKKV